jgi:hypothetical protein
VKKLHNCRNCSAGREKCAKSEWSRSDGWTNCFLSLRIDRTVIWMNAIQCHRDLRVYRTHEIMQQTQEKPDNFAQCQKAACGWCGFCASSLLKMRCSHDLFATVSRNQAEETWLCVCVAQYTFPGRRPLNQPPPRCGELVHGRPTPTYALARACPSRTFFRRAGEGGRLQLHRRCLRELARLSEI